MGYVTLSLNCVHKCSELYVQRKCLLSVLLGAPLTEWQRAKGLIVNHLPYSKTFQGAYNLHIKNSALKSRYFTCMYVTKIEIQGKSYVSQGP